MKYLKFIAFTVLAMFAGELHNNGILQGRMDYFLLAVGLYVFIGTIFYFMGNLLDRIAPQRSDIIGYFAAGLLGLIIIEWLILGNHPGSGRGAVQTGMFAWWAAVFTVPRIFTEIDGKPARKSVLITIIIYSVIGTALVIALLGKLPVPILAGITGLMLAIYAIVLSFMFLPYLEKIHRSRALRIFMWLLVLGLLVNVAQW